MTGSYARATTIDTETPFRPASFYGVSNNSQQFWDNHLSNDLGRKPKDSVNQFADDPNLIPKATPIAYKVALSPLQAIMIIMITVPIKSKILSIIG